MDNAKLARLVLDRKICIKFIIKYNSIWIPEYLRSLFLDEPIKRYVISKSRLLKMIDRSSELKTRV